MGPATCWCWGLGERWVPPWPEWPARRSRPLGETARSWPSRASAIPPPAQGLEAAGVRTLTGDLLDPDVLRELPDAPDVVFMAGRKFGSTGAEHLTWVMNAHLPGLVGAAVSGGELRRLLHRRRVPVHGGRRAGRGRGRGSRADWGVRAVVPGKGADVRVRGAHLGHALGADPAFVRAGPALWGAARHRGQPARRSASEPRDEPGQRDLAGRCLRSDPADAGAHLGAAVDAERVRPGADSDS